MFKIIRFYKENNRWYADVPNHTPAENEMVAGADDFLEYISKGKSEVSVSVTDDLTENHFASFYLEEHDEIGGTYLIKSNDDNIDKQRAWICNVTHDVLGEHPEYFCVDIN